MFVWYFHLRKHTPTRTFLLHTTHVMAYFDGTHSKATSDWKMSFRVDSIWREEGGENRCFSTSLSNEHSTRKKENCHLKFNAIAGGDYDGDVSLPFVCNNNTKQQQQPASTTQPPSNKSITIKNDAYIIHSKLVERILCQNKQQQKKEEEKR